MGKYGGRSNSSGKKAIDKQIKTQSRRDGKGEIKEGLEKWEEVRTNIMEKPKETAKDSDAEET